MQYLEEEQTLQNVLNVLEKEEYQKIQSAVLNDQDRMSTLLEHEQNISGSTIDMKVHFISIFN